MGLRLPVHVLAASAVLTSALAIPDPASALPLPYHWPLEGWFSAFGTNAFDTSSAMRSPYRLRGRTLTAALAER